MEKGEQLSQKTYREIAKQFPNAKSIEKDEQRHEKEILGMLQDENIKYASSIVLGLNDALVELTGVLAGLTLALANNKIIAINKFSSLKLVSS